MPAENRVLTSKTSLVYDPDLEDDGKTDVQLVDFRDLVEGGAIDDTAAVEQGEQSG